MSSISKCQVVAELCCNHQGDINIAKKMIQEVRWCGADYAKFQKRNPEKAVPLHMHNQPHPCPMHSFGETYLDHRKNLEFTLEQHKELKKYCEDIGIKYACSVWDEDSARDIIGLNPDFIKVPSAMNENYYLLNILFNEFQKDIHISLGMIDKAEREKLLDYLHKYRDRVVVYWTTSGYPVQFSELFLLEITSLTKYFPRVGFSGHNYGVAADIAAAVLGASWIERHFTLDRTMKGTDNAASLEKGGLERLCRDLNAVYQACRFKTKLTDDEIKNAEKLKIKR